MFVTWMVVVEVCDGDGEASGVTVVVVVAVTRDAPLEGETPLIQVVLPEWTSKTNGKVLEVVTEDSEWETE